MEIDYTRYPGMPITIEADTLLAQGNLSFHNDRVSWRLNGIQPIRFHIDRTRNSASPHRRKRFTDVVDISLAGLEDYLVPGSEIRKDFDKYRDRVTDATDEKYWSLGTYTYYPKTDELFYHLPKRWHRLSLVASNGDLYSRDSQNTNPYTWSDVRNCFDSSVIAIVGGSVGSIITRVIAGDIRPEEMKIADNAPYKLANLNRVPIGLRELGINKAVATAQILHQADPYLRLHVFQEGVTESNINDFLTDPQPSIVAEEADDPLVKILVRERTRAARLPLIMATDAGSVAQVDIQRYDLDPSLTIAPGLPDAELYKRKQAFEDNPTDVRNFVDFATALVGTDGIRNEFAEWIYRLKKPTFMRVPQLGSTATVAAGFVSEAIARFLLGEQTTNRIIIDKQNLKLEVAK